MKNILYILALIFVLSTNYLFAQSSCASMVKNFGKEENIDYVSNVTKLNDKTALFFGTDEFHGTELWKTDGTENGTLMLKDIYPGLRSSIGRFVSNKSPFSYAGILYFYADAPDDNTSNVASLWRSDGTTSGTYQLRAIADRNTPLLAENTSFTVYKNSIYFWSYKTLYRTQGTLESTVAVLTPEFDFDYGRLGSFVEYKGELWFADQKYLCHTNGTKEGTTRLNISLNRTPDALQVVGDKLYFNLGGDLWVTDGTASGIMLVREGVAGSDMFSINNTLCYIGSKGLWRSDGTLTGTFRIHEASISDVFYYKNELYFISLQKMDASSKLALYKTDGTKDGTKLAVLLDNFYIDKSIVFGISSSFFEKNGLLYFVLRNYHSQYEIWQTDGTQTGTRPVCSLKNGNFTIYPGTVTKSLAYSQFIRIPLTLMDTYILYTGTENFSSKYSSAIYRTDLTSCPDIKTTVVGAATFCAGSSTNLSATSSGGTAPYTYRWQQGSVTVGSSISSLTINSAGTYTITATDANGCVGSAQIAITQRTGPAVTVSPNTAAFCTGQSTVLTASASASTSPYSYQWKQGSATVGTSAATLTVNAGGTYSVSATDAAGCSSPIVSATVTQRSAPTATVTASAPGFTIGGSVTLTASESLGLSYQWLRDGQPISGATLSVYTATQPGTYAVTLSGSECSTTSSALTISLITAMEESLSGIDFEMSASPNPTPGIIEIRLKNQRSQPVLVMLIMHDLTGRRVYQQPIKLSNGSHTQHIDLSQYPAGLYLLNATTDQQQTSLRLVRE